ncbi:MAG: hypothetical protein J6S93_03835 [Paludibacteraceae bacterium]|nr:hypothetical protein [Paludibacteraceae bacterium]
MKKKLIGITISVLLTLVVLMTAIYLIIHFAGASYLITAALACMIGAGIGVNVFKTMPTKKGAQRFVYNSKVARAIRWVILKIAE